MKKEKVVFEGPVDVLEKVPGLLGFTPKNSLVLLSVSEDDVLVDARCITLGKKQTEKAENYVPILRSMSGETGAVIAVFFVDYKITWAKFGEDFMDLNDFWFKDVIYLNKENRWGSYICKDELCCPNKGKLLEKVLVSA
jgi:hypothetical protein